MIFTDFIDVDADPEEINQAFIALAMTENTGSLEDNDKVTDKLNNSVTSHEGPNVKNAHFNVAQWENTNEEEILRTDENTIIMSETGHDCAENGEDQSTKPTDSSTIFYPSVAIDTNAHRSSRVQEEPGNFQNPSFAHV